MSTSEDANATRRGSGSNDLLGPLTLARGLRDRAIAHGGDALLLDCAYVIEQMCAERERWENRIEVLSRHDDGTRRAWHSGGAWLYAGDALAVVRA